MVEELVIGVVEKGKWSFNGHSIVEELVIGVVEMVEWSFGGHSIAEELVVGVIEMVWYSFNGQFAIIIFTFSIHYFQLTNFH